MEALEGCYVLDLNEVFSKINDYKFYWGAVFIIVGFFSLFFGLKMLKITIFTFVMLSVSLFTLLFFYGIFLYSNS